MRPECSHLTRPGGVSMVGVLITSGVPVADAYRLPCRDVHEMALLVARSRQWAEGERTLIAEIPTPALPTPSWLSMHVQGAVTAALILLFVALLCTAMQIAS